MFHQNEESIKTKIIYIVNSVIRMDSDKQIKMMVLVQIENITSYLFLIALS